MLNVSDAKDWCKITARRGNGPLLRDNTLKLLENSSVSVFQWNKSMYRCFCCKLPFQQIQLLKEHTSKEHTIGDIEKEIILQQNRMVKVEVSDIQCNICHKQLQHLDGLRTHLSEAHGINFEINEDLLVPFKLDEELKCQICSEQFLMFRLLNIHMNKHYQKQVCHVCGAGFSNLVFLNLHKTRYHRVLKCSTCNLELNCKKQLRQHDITVHGVKLVRKSRFPCPYCEERFNQEKFRVLHLVEKHGMTKPEYKCKLCPKVFVTRSLCTNHMKLVHMKSKSHECEVCFKSFFTRYDLTRHSVTHTGERNYSCSVCHRNFASKDSLRRHLRSHDS